MRHRDPERELRADPRAQRAGARGRPRGQGAAHAPSSFSQPGKVEIADIRDIDVTDLLGRHQIDTDIDVDRGLPDGQACARDRAPAARSAPSCAARSPSSHPTSSSCSTATSLRLHAVQLSIYGTATARLGRRRAR